MSVQQRDPSKIEILDPAVRSNSGAISLSVILPVIDETESLKKTIDIVLDENAECIHQVLLIVCRMTTPVALAVCQDLCDAMPDLIEMHFQKRPFLGGAMQDAFEWATGSHVLMMASDLETDPGTVKDMLAVAREGWDIVTASRWIANGAFEGYSPMKYALNWMFQRFFAILYGTSLSDLTYGFRIFKSQWVKSIRWEETRHPLLLETVLKPLRLGAKITEVPTVWRARNEGTSHNSFWRTFVYFRIAVRVRLCAKRNLLKDSSPLCQQLS